MFENRHRSPTGRGGLFICSKLRQNLSEMEVRTFVRIQRVIWDHLLVLRLKLSRSKLYFSFRADQLAKNNYELELMMQSALFFLSFSFLACRGNFSSKSRKERSEKMFLFKLRFQAIIFRFFDRNVGLCCSCFSVAMGDRGYFRWIKQWLKVKNQSSGKGGGTQIVQGPLQALLSRAPPGSSKANLGTTHTESLFCRLRWPIYVINTVHKTKLSYHSMHADWKNLKEHKTERRATPISKSSR